MGLRIHTDAFNLSLFNRVVSPMQPYLKVELPSYSLKGDTKMTITRNDTSILNQSQFIDTLTQAVYQKKFTMSAKGSTVGHLGALNTPLTLDKDVELDGICRTQFKYRFQNRRLILYSQVWISSMVSLLTRRSWSFQKWLMGPTLLARQPYRTTQFLRLLWYESHIHYLVFVSRLRLKES